MLFIEIRLHEPWDQRYTKIISTLRKEGFFITRDDESLISGQKDESDGGVTQFHHYFRKTFGGLGCKCTVTAEDVNLDSRSVLELTEYYGGEDAVKVKNPISAYQAKLLTQGVLILILILIILISILLASDYGLGVGLAYFTVSNLLFYTAFN